MIRGVAFVPRWSSHGRPTSRSRTRSVNAPLWRRSILAASIGALLVGACTTTTSPRGTDGASSAASASPARPSVSPASSIAPASATPPAASPSVGPEPSAVNEPEPPEELSGTAGPGCGTGAKGFFAHRGELPDALHFGGTTIEFTTAAIGLRNGTYVADDAIPAGVGLEPDEIAVRVTPGTHIILRGDGMTIAEVEVRDVPWATVSFEGGLGDSNAEPTELRWRARSDGSISVSAPNEVGDYMVEFGPRWHTTCLVGDGSAYSRIKVVAP